MNKRCLIWSNPKQAIYCIMAILMVIGCINVFSASYIVAQSENLSSYHYFGRYVIYAVLGMGCIYTVRKIRYRWFMRPRNIMLAYIASLVLVLLVYAVGVEANGAKRWLHLGFITFQPSELAKVVVIMLTAFFLSRTIRSGRTVSLLSKTSGIVLGFVIFLAVLVGGQPDKGTGAIIAGLSFGVFMAAGLNKKQLALIFVSCILGVLLIGLSSTYSTNRLNVWLNPWSDPTGHGYQTVQSLLSIGSGGLTGVSWGGGYAKFHYLPEAHTDFAFAVFCQESGFLGAIIVIFLFLALGYAFLRIAFSTRDEKAYLLVSGMMLYIVGQACANMAMVCGLLPVIGVPLPLISYGGTSMLTTMGAIGLVLSVYDVECELERDEERPPEQRRQDLQFVESGRWKHHG